LPQPLVLVNGGAKKYSLPDEYLEERTKNYNVRGEQNQKPGQFVIPKRNTPVRNIDMA
jgi:hypothetical protein